MRIKYYSIGVFCLLVACGSSKEPSSQTSSNQADPELLQLNESAAKSQTTAVQLAGLMLGADGIAAKTQAIRTMPITTVTEIRAWRAERDELRLLLEDASEPAARFALEAHAVEANRREFLSQQSLLFPWTSMDVSAQGGEQVARVQQPIVIAVLAVATFSIGAYRFLKGFGELADNAQRMVYTTANGSDESRKAVITILRKKGVDISDSASSDDVIEIFKEQPRDLRRTITTDVEAWNESKFNDSDPSVADAAQSRFQEAKDDVPQIANEGGGLAVTQTVSLVQSVTGGVGSIVGGVPGAAADLALTAAEMNPTDIVQRNVTVYVAAGEKVDLPTETSTTPLAEAIGSVERAQAGDPSIGPDELQEAASSLIQEVAGALRDEFGPSVQLAQKIALGHGSLDNKKQADGTVQHNTTLSLPSFSNGEVAEVVVVREGHLPQEVTGHVLGPSNAILLENPPLLGTITAESTPGPLDPAGSQLFDVTGHVIRVPKATQLICQGTNAVCSPSSASILKDSSTSFTVEVFGRAQLRLIRRDTGESYSMILNGTTTDTEPQPGNTPSNLDANLIGKWTFTDASSDGDVYSWAFLADGTCIQGTPTGSYDWQWTIEDGQLKLSSNGGTPTFKQYKIDGNQLYFWADTIGDWALPFTKQ